MLQASTFLSFCSIPGLWVVGWNFTATFRAAADSFFPFICFQVALEKLLKWEWVKYKAGQGKSVVKLHNLCIRVIRGCNQKTSLPTFKCLQMYHCGPPQHCFWIPAVFFKTVVVQVLSMNCKPTEKKCFCLVNEHKEILRQLMGGVTSTSWKSLLDLFTLRRKLCIYPQSTWEFPLNFSSLKWKEPLSKEQENVWCNYRDYTEVSVIRWMCGKWSRTIRIWEY